MRDYIEDAVRQAGFHNLNRAHVALFRQRTLDGVRPTDLAQEMRITKQSVNDLLRDLEREGYIRREVDPSDKRGRLIRLTARGRKLEDTVRLAAQDAERRLERGLGKAQMRALRAALIEAPRMLNLKVDEGQQPHRIDMGLHSP